MGRVRIASIGRHVSCAALVALVALAFAANTQAQNLSQFMQGSRIAQIQIDFEAGPQSDDGEYRQAIELSVRAGDELSADKVHESIERLVGNGIASRVAVDVAPMNGTPENVVLTYRIRRLVRVASIDLDGVQEELRDEVRARLNNLDVGRPITQPAVDRGAEEIVRFYQERGYFEVSVRSAVELDEAGTRATVVYDVERGERTRVSQFEIMRDRSILPELEKNLVLQPGRPYSLPELEADLATIRRGYIEAGYLDPTIGTPEITRNPAANTVAIELPVTSGPIVEVVVEGFEFKEKELRTVLPIYREGGLDEYQLSEGDRQLLDELQRDGYFFARVDHRIEDGARPNSRRVVYTVEPGRRYKVTDIDIEGTEAITFDEISNQLRSKEKVFFLLSRGITSRELLERDSDTIEANLSAIGYRKAQVVEQRLGVSPDSDELVITFVVEEGPRTRISDVMMRGNYIYAANELLAEPAVKAGEFYSAEAIRTDANRILQRYATDGYVTAEVVSQIVELDQERARLVFNVVEGRKAYIRSITINGNALTKESAIQNFLEFQEGEELRLDRLRRTERNLYDTGAFRQVVIHHEYMGVAEDGVGEKRAVIIDVEEAKPWLLSYGGGFNTDDGARGIFEISNKNLFGRLNTGALRLRASPREQLAQISYTNPVPLGYDLPALFSVSFQRELKDAFNSLRFSTLAQLQKRLDERTLLFFRYNFQQVRVFDLQVSQGELERSDRPVRLGRLSVAYVRDARNSVFDPDDGYYLSLDASIASLILGGSEQYTRLFAEYQRYDRVPKFDSLVYAGAVQFGVADPYGGNDELPISERFFSGGARTLRGFKFEQAGPRDPVTNQPVGGNVLLVVKNELRFPLFWRFGGAVFSDTGNVFRRFSDFDVDDITQTFGVGLRFDTPVGPVRVDIGYLLNRPDGVPSTAVHFSFGQPF